MIAHLIRRNGDLQWSGYLAAGDPRHAPYAFVVDVGRDFSITGEGRLYLTGPGPAQFAEFTREGLIVAARSGMFGLRMVEAGQPAGAPPEKASAPIPETAT